MSKKESKNIVESSKGADNDHKFFKEAQVDDSEGMVKYSVDLDDSDEKLSEKVKSQIQVNKK